MRASIGDERSVITLLMILMLFLWLGFLVHAAPSFPGSMLGTALGIVGALLMLDPLLYSAVKRIAPLKRLVTRRFSLRKQLVWHVYAGILGPLLGLVHSAHRYESTLGILLTVTMMLAVVTGFVGRHLLGACSGEIADKQRQLVSLRRRFDGLRATVPVAASIAADEVDARDRRVVELVDAIADTEYGIQAHDWLNTAFRLWVRVHTVTGWSVLVLLVLHVWVELQVGLRWL